MTSQLSRRSLCLCVLWIFATAIHGDFIEPPPEETLQSVADEETVLPCRYKPDGDDKVIQVTWFKNVGDKKEQIITAHHDSGQTAFGTWSQRVRFKSDKPIEDSSLVIMSTEISDEGEYTCHISTFPSGNFDRTLSLIVWTIPITSLDIVTVVEGQSFRQVAACRSIARPPAILTWDTELNGKSTNRTSDSGAVSIQFSLHPLRNMNGKKLDCLVRHPTLPGARRLSQKLVVHFPPDVEVSGFNNNWFVGLENAALTCVSRGNPKPHSFTWSRMGGELPNGVIAHPNGTLAFQRPLNSSDRGIYQCAAKNEVGVAKAEMEITVPEQPVDNENILMFVVGGVAGGLLILMLVIVICVTCKQKRKNKKLEKELTEKKEEISTLSRHASFRRMNSVSTDARGTTEENIPLRVEGTLRNSLSSLGEQPYCRDSRSTISGGRGGERGGAGAFDSLGRPVLYNNSRRGRYLDRGEDSRSRLDTYDRCSSVSMETRFHPPLMPSPVPNIHSTEIVRQLNGSAVTSLDGGSRAGSVTKNHLRPPASCTYPPVTDDEDEVDEGLGGPASQEHPDDRDSVTSSSQVSEAHSTRYQHTNGGTLIVKTPMSSIASPHASLIHKAQIV